ncbi:hypothetical protein BCR34DRAFT_566845, partial [Clohesyomyces aquaticus]
MMYDGKAVMAVHQKARATVLWLIVGLREAAPLLAGSLARRFILLPHPALELVRRLTEFAVLAVRFLGADAARESLLGRFCAFRRCIPLTGGQSACQRYCLLSGHGCSRFRKYKKVTNIFKSKRFPCKSFFSYTGLALGSDARCKISFSGTSSD